MHGLIEARRQPTQTELRAHARHAAFHREIAERAVALTTRADPVPACPPPPSVHACPRRFFSDAWGIIESEAPPQPLTMRQIKEAVCKHFGLEIKMMVTGRRAKSEVIPRQIAMFLCKELTRNSLPQIGRNFGGSDHTTVLHACFRVPIYCKRSPPIKEAIAKIRAELESLL